MDGQRVVWLAVRPLLIVGLLGGLGVAPGAKVRADTTPTYYYCVIGTPQSGGINRYTAPQPGLRCYTDEATAEHSMDPYYFCVTGGPDAWKITAYTAPQPGESCYETAGQAVETIPQSVQALVPPGGSYDAQACSGTEPAGAVSPGSVYFIRCSGGILAITMADPSNSPTSTATSRHALWHQARSRLFKLVRGIWRTHRHGVASTRLFIRILPGFTLKSIGLNPRSNSSQSDPTRMR